MGADRNGPPLPAPTETDSTTDRTELGSKVTETKSSYSLPEDGSPVTIPTRRKREKDGQHNLGSNNNKSQTSLLIEYFEGGKNGQAESRRPSVRVKVTPSSKSRSRNSNDHIQITERKGTRKPSYTKRIPLSPHVKKDDRSPEDDVDDTSLLSYRSATEESNVTSRTGPIEVEIMPMRHGSPLIPTGDGASSYIQPNASEISSMPADSFLDGNGRSPERRSPERKRSRSLSRGEILAAGAATGLAVGALGEKLRTPSRRRSRSLSRERIVAQKAVEKVRGEKSERRRKHRSSRSRSRSISGELHAPETIKSPRRRSSRDHHNESMLSGAGSSMLNSQVSGKSDDRYSYRSGTSKSSINNPKLLETVEDAIRRLILPELTALKREQSKHRDRERRNSVTSGSGVSRDSREESSSTRRQSDRGSDSSAKPKVVLNDNEVLSGNTVKGRKDKNVDRIKLDDESPPRFERDTSEDTVVRNGERISKKRSSDQNKVAKAAIIGAGMGALTAAALHKHQSEDSIEGAKSERRRRRTKSRSRSDSLIESVEEQEHPPVPPMPLMSDINASEITRSSILSAETERPNSASQERVTPIREVRRGVISPSPLTPTRTPTRTPVALQQGLGTQHSNYSRGNLHSPAGEQQIRGQEFELNEDGRKVFMPESFRHEREDSYVEEDQTPGHSPALVAGLAGAAVGAGLAAAHLNDDSEDSELFQPQQNYYQEVPPPLRYVPYAQERRGLSPIQSVSGYTEGDPDQRSRRDSRLTQSTTGSFTSLNLNKSVPPNQAKSVRSLDSLGNVHGNPHDFPEVRQGGLTESELTQDGEYWEEQHRENDRNRDFDGDSYRSSGVDYKHMTTYTDDSMDTQDLDRVSTGQNVRGLGANPDYVHTPIAVESAVASLVNASELTGESGYSGKTGQDDRRESYASYEDGSERNFTSRGNSPTKREITRDQEYNCSNRGTPTKRNSPLKYAEEYELDESGRKVTMPNFKKSATTEKATVAGIAAGAAAAVLASRKKKSPADQIKYEDRLEHTGAPLQKSFKDRALDNQGQLPSPRHSIDAPLSEAASHEQLKLGASGLPDLNDPMPEIGFGDGDSDVMTNPSIINGPIGGVSGENRDHWPGKPTPPQPQYDASPASQEQKDSNLKAAEAALVGAAIGAGGAAAIANHNREVSNDLSGDEWQRTSSDRKRDTLITNPYEGTSPIAALGGDLNRDLLGQGYAGSENEYATNKLGGYQTGSPGNFQKDEGYISSAPNARSPVAVTPEPRMRGVNFADQGNEGGTGADPFYSPNHTRHLSGMSHGMGSPIYDSATGNGIDRIQSKDIVALMDHLTVRDAQRSARDTEILVTLVRAAAEMRNSFEGMKRLLADTEDQIITEVQGNTEKSVQKVINGPRPFPQSAPRSLRQGSQDGMIDDIPNKKRNVFRRALKGLSMKSSNDLGKIEEMLVQLLGEVEGLKAAQGFVQGNHGGESYDDLRQERSYEEDRGYEPEGLAGTSTASHASQSGHLSLPLSRGASQTKGFDGRKFSDHRISTVPEGDEEDLDHHEQVVLNNQFENNEQMLTPTRDIARGGSVPLETPPSQQYNAPASASNENTPKTDKSKKHKSSGSSSWIPKVSRWSETTASTVLRGFRSSGRSSGKKQDDQYATPPSRSGSALDNYADRDPYDHDELHSGFSQAQLQQYNENEQLMSSQLPPEDPKYKAHRNSLNLQHPQPRPGPTHRYQTALETQAQNFDSPMSPRSLDWGSQTSLNRLPPQQMNRYSTGTNETGRMSPVSDGAYSNISASQQPPARPPKEPLAPERPPKVRNGKLVKPSPLSNEHLPVNDNPECYDEPLASPRSSICIPSNPNMLGVPKRKPTGPRSMSSASKSGDLNREEGTVRRNKNRDTFGTIASNHSGESETF